MRRVLAGVMVLAAVWGSAVGMSDEASAKFKAYTLAPATSIEGGRADTPSVPRHPDESERRPERRPIERRRAELRAG